ncbi:uncharacterized protein LOC110708966 [Chenopodium quinoa]|uniref:uncharacterized protein LOC110708966 n=1 Tax=Chenopodium quinoa TaxID=63459 RepID=UPI000B774B28|nr:uncharacterized protein LOC110708966 [Chenopodium quinoa]
MAYIAPHKRLSKNQEGPPPKPVLPNFNKSLDLNSSRSSSDKRREKFTTYAKNVVYASHSISRWLAIPSMDDMQLSSSLSLAPVNFQSTEFKPGEKLFSLVNGLSQQESHDTKSCRLEHMWESVAETVHADLLSAFQNLRNELVDQHLEESKTAVVARFGKVLFRRNPSCNLDLVKESSVSESRIKQLKRIFYTNVPVEYMKHIKETVLPELGVHFNEEKDVYRVKLADAKRSESIVSCKFRVNKDENKLELYKASALILAVQSMS